MPAFGIALTVLVVLAIFLCLVGEGCKLRRALDHSRYPIVNFDNRDKVSLLKTVGVVRLCDKVDLLVAKVQEDLSFASCIHGQGDGCGSSNVVFLPDHTVGLVALEPLEGVGTGRADGETKDRRDQGNPEFAVPL